MSMENAITLDFSVITGGIPSCAQQAPWNVLLEDKANNDGTTQGYEKMRINPMKILRF